MVETAPTHELEVCFLCGVPMSMKYYLVCTMCGAEEGTAQAVYANGQPIKGICETCNAFYLCPDCGGDVKAYDLTQHLMNHGWPYAMASKVSEQASV